MLTIREEQNQVLSSYMRESYVHRTCQKLARLFPNDPRLRDQTALASSVEQGIGCAAVYGIVEQRAVTLFVFLQHQFGPEFEKHPNHRWMDTILSEKTYSGQEKMDVIYARLRLAASSH